ncbi:unnamed protein product [Oikopleura dioica]|uniref:Uncharacterized protein n=1 Tax=Oikopleura dioica TaxID=34765 RepID=E4YCX8_OIKDI|nr:unnamed protein product [Oikopleura dioica]
MEEKAKITISGFQIKKEAPNSKRRRNKFIIGMERVTDASCKAKKTGRDNGSNMNKLLNIIVLFASISLFCKRV